MVVEDMIEDLRDMCIRLLKMMQADLAVLVASMRTEHAPIEKEEKCNLQMAVEGTTMSSLATVPSSQPSPMEAIVSCHHPLSMRPTTAFLDYIVDALTGLNIGLVRWRNMIGGILWARSMNVEANLMSGSRSRGGLELLLEKSTKVHKVDVQPNGGEGKVMMKGLLSWVKSNLIKERPEMFLKGASVRPGVLVLINDCDWELCGGVDAELEEKDVVVFISTLHGG
uniref:Ubiquitin-related modifier 1 homolog n=1 Tax=Oryza brachyantha TaxID=4533 RepID=J3MKN7_ORYBR